MSTAVADRLFERDGDGEEVSPWTPVRWGVCFAAIVALHVGAAWIALHWQPAEAPAPPPPPAAIMIELAPLPAAPPAPPSEIPPGPKQQVSLPPPPEPVVQPILPPAPPTPAPKVEVPLPPKPKPKPPERHRRIVVHERPKPKPDNKPPAPATTAPPQVEAPPAPTVAAPAPGVAAAPSTNAVPTWQGLLLNRLEQFKRYPSIAQLRHQQGVAYLRFTMDRHGKVLTARIEKSSGFDVLDDEALALIHRAEPLPPPPPEIPGDPIELVVPIQFFLKE
ncbi:MAG TPA: TonB family protein [Stellaceae bacterium]|nr:TonB family protein [Stellaceae bacterium]